MLMMPIIFLLVASVMLVGFIGSSFGNIASGGQVIYDEAVFQDYANREYAKAFGSSSAYEDNILLVFLTNEEANGFYTIAWVGDNINSSINYMFGDQTTEYGVAVLGNINNDYYAYSLDSNLAGVVDNMREHIARLGLASSFKKDTDRSVVGESKLVNYTSLALTASTVEDALDEFTAETDIPIVIVVEDMAVVFGKTVTGTDWVGVLVSLVFIVVAIAMFREAFKSRKNGKNGSDSSNGQNGGNGQGYNSYEYK